MFLFASRISGSGLFLPPLLTMMLYFILVGAAGADINRSVSEWSLAFQPVPHLLSLACFECSPHSVPFHLVLALCASVLLILKSLKPHLEVVIYYKGTCLWLNSGIAISAKEEWCFWAVTSQSSVTIAGRQGCLGLGMFGLPAWPSVIRIDVRTITVFILEKAT